MPRLAAIFVLAIAVSGCGSQPVADERDGTIELTLRDFRIAPQSIRAPGRVNLTIIVENSGRVAHNLRIRGAGGTRVKFKTMLPGASSARVVKLPRGDWTLFCSLANHEDLGLYGKLVLR